jgi:hypothetical protein
MSQDVAMCSGWYDRQIAGRNTFVVREIGLRIRFKCLQTALVTMMRNGWSRGLLKPESDWTPLGWKDRLIQRDSISWLLRFLKELCELASKWCTSDFVGKKHKYTWTWLYTEDSQDVNRLCGSFWSIIMIKWEQKWNNSKRQGMYESRMKQNSTHEEIARR